MTAAELERKVLGYVTSELMGGRNAGDLGPQDDLLTSGLVDSLGVMRLVQFVEAELGIRVPPGDVTIENFVSAKAIAAYAVDRRDRDVV